MNVKVDENIKISVIIPVYNVERYLSRCLDSVINQTLKNIEIICINDGSKDNSLKILEEYAQKDNRIRILNQENQGVSSARNLGLKFVRGEYIGFVDSDDWIETDFYEKLYNAAVQNDCDIACGNIVRRKKTKTRFIVEYKDFKCSCEMKEKILLAKIPKHCYIVNKIYKTKMLLKSGLQFLNDMNYEDCIFSPQIIEFSNKLITVPDVFYNYSKNKNSIMHTNNDKNRADHIEARQFLQEFCAKYKISCANIGKYLSKEEYYFLGIKLMKVCHYRATTKYLLFGFLPILICQRN